MRPRPSANAYLVSGPGVLSLDRACRGGVARDVFGGISRVVLARPHGFNASTFFEPRALTEAGAVRVRWDREQLIGGKAIEPRK